MRPRLAFGNRSGAGRGARFFALPVVLPVLMVAALPATAHAQTTTLGASDFTLAVARFDASGNAVALGADALASYFTAARCACPTNVAIGVAVAADSVSKLTDSDALDVTLMAGPACDQPSATGCTTLGSGLTLSASSTSTAQTVSSSALFAAVLSSATCTTLPATSTRLWAIIRDNSALLGTQPSVTIAFGGAPPPAPTAVKVLTADSGLAVSWTASADATILQGHQILCLPGPAKPPAAAYEICDAARPATGTGPFATLDASFVCSDLIPIGTASTRVSGLQNLTTYQLAVIAIGNDGTPSAPSDVVTETPGPTLGFDDLYKMAGGTAQGGCAVGGASRGGGGAGGIALGGLMGALALRARRRRTARDHARRLRSAVAAAIAVGLAVVAFVVVALAPRAARATDAEEGDHGFIPGLTFEKPTTRGPSPRAWNLELRFGPYRPDVDSEFSDRGQPDRPFQDVFSSSRHVLSVIELDRHVSHRGGTWAIGVASGYYRVSAASLSADRTMRTGDQTALRLIPLSLSAVYRADILRERFGFPIIPYAKLGVDCMLWSITDTSTSGGMSGRTFGWHAAGGVSLDLSFLDPDAARTMDIESGVNQFALFFEYARYSLDGFGSSQALHVGDTTWFVGAMFEF